MDLNLDEEVRCLESTIPTRVKKLVRRGCPKCVKDGPWKPCYGGMSSVERQVTEDELTKKRKRHLNVSWHVRLCVMEVHHNESTATVLFTCNLSPMLHTIDQVRCEQLRVGLTFPYCKYILL